MTPDDHQDDHGSGDDLGERGSADPAKLYTAFRRMVAGRGDDERWSPEPNDEEVLR